MVECWTQQQIAEEVELEQKQVSNILGSFSKNSKFTKITKMSGFEPNPYNIWSYGKQEPDERNQKILDLPLRCWTKVDIAKELDISDMTVGKVLNQEKMKFQKILIPKGFEPNPYNIWSYGSIIKTVFAQSFLNIYFFICC